jgi:hypothetical protein
MYEVGTWVKVAQWDYLNFIGYVVQNNPITKAHLINITIGKWGYPLKKPVEIEVHEDYLYEPGMETDFDTTFLEDLALDWALATKNEQLFHEIRGGQENVER